MTKFNVGDKTIGLYGGKRTILTVGETHYFYRQINDYGQTVEGIERIDFADEHWEFDVAMPVKGEKWHGGAYDDYEVVVHCVSDGVVVYNQPEYEEEYFGTPLKRFTEYFKKVEDNG